MVGQMAAIKNQYVYRLLDGTHWIYRIPPIVTRNPLRFVLSLAYFYCTILLLIMCTGIFIIIRDALVYRLSFHPFVAHLLYGGVLIVLALLWGLFGFLGALLLYIDLIPNHAGRYRERRIRGLHPRHIDPALLEQLITATPPDDQFSDGRMIALWKCNRADNLQIIFDHLQTYKGGEFVFWKTPLEDALYLNYDSPEAIEMMLAVGYRTLTHIHRLAELRVPAIKPELREMLKSENHNSRTTGLRGLRYFVTPDLVPNLQELLLLEAKLWRRYSTVTTREEYITRTQLAIEILQQIDTKESHEVIESRNKIITRTEALIATDTVPEEQL